MFKVNKKEYIIYIIITRNTDHVEHAMQEVLHLRVGRDMI
jgi:hypothetical protein